MVNRPLATSPSEKESCGRKPSSPSIALRTMLCPLVAASRARRSRWASPCSRVVPVERARVWKVTSEPLRTAARTRRSVSLPMVARGGWWRRGAGGLDGSEAGARSRPGRWQGAPPVPPVPPPQSSRGGGGRGQRRQRGARVRDGVRPGVADGREREGAEGAALLGDGRGGGGGRVAGHARRPLDGDGEVDADAGEIVRGVAVGDRRGPVARDEPGVEREHALGAAAGVVVEAAVAVVVHAVVDVA